jgi:NitT/TauT family transport system substrate-binding protein
MNATHGSGNPLRFLLLATLILSLLTGSIACSPTAAPSSKETVSLKFGTLPIVDTLPLHVADTEGLFAKQNLKVELVPFASAVERDAALSAGQLDGELNDLISTGLLNKDAENVKIVRVALRSSDQFAQLAVLVGPQSGAKSVADLKGSEIAISKNSMIEYGAADFLAQGGLKESDLKVTEISKIPVRLEMLMAGQVPAIVVPEPFISLGVKQGAKVIANDSGSKQGLSVITFRKETLAKNPAAVRSFLAAYEQAVATITASPQKYRSLLVDRAKIPDILQESFTMPPYPNAGVPTEAEIDKATKWMSSKGLLPKAISYQQMVDGSFLPK